MGGRPSIDWNDVVFELTGNPDITPELMQTVMYDLRMKGPIKKVAAELGVSYDSLMKQYRRLGIPTDLRGEKPWTAGKTQTE